MEQSVEYKKDIREESFSFCSLGSELKTLKDMSEDLACGWYGVSSKEEALISIIKYWKSTNP